MLVKLWKTAWRGRRAAAASLRRAHTASDDELRAARTWLAQLTVETIPRSICAVSFSRSSGPGGQNVNKVNSKATIKVPMSALLPLVPKILHPSIRSSRYYAENSQALVIQADESRKQSQNLNACFDKLTSMIAEAGRAAVPGETSPEQKKKVQKLQKAANEARIRMKKAHSNKKSSRKGRSDE
ncbi:TPA_exp: Peptidyl-tRNA hydrolase domain protein [Trichophyton benhamiae CBS 112371]|nr:TPA_exp: Peptidyl-tRNA hydrolase domain protein [Trichophyton benhamiae CBS 112371]